jgi:hypothetical protein
MCYFDSLTSPPSAPHNRQTINILEQLHPKRLPDNDFSINDVREHDTTDLSDHFLDVSTADIANILDGFSFQSLPTIDLDINVVRHRIISYRKMVSSGPIPWLAELSWKTE